MKNIADDGLVTTILEKLKKISIDNIPDSAYLQKLLSDRKNSLFKQIGTTEKPDIFVAKLMEGRIGIIVDGSPLALTAPFLFLEDFQNSEDYYKSPYKTNMERLLRVVSIFIAVFLPGIFVAAQLFHMEFIPLKFLLTIVSSVRGIPLSPTYEMFFTLLIFEILNEASVRMPKYVGMAVSIVGALVLGETAVQAGIVSSPTILIMAPEYAYIPYPSSWALCPFSALVYCSLQERSADTEYSSLRLFYFSILPQWKALEFHIYLRMHLWY